MKTQRYEVDPINATSSINAPAPDHDVDMPPAVVRQFRPQTHEWAVFIFLYNEGLNIRRQLMRFSLTTGRNFYVLVVDDGKVRLGTGHLLLRKLSIELILGRYQ
jgi:hypothetical protein